MPENPISFYIEDDTLFAKASGRMRFEHIITHYQQLFESEGFYVGIPALYDFLEVPSVSGDINHFEQVAREMGDSQVIDKPSYVAIVVSEQNEMMKGIFTAYCRMVDYTNMNARVFTDKSEALAWLGSSKQQSGL